MRFLTALVPLGLSYCRFRCLIPASHAALQIDRMSDWLQMVRIHAAVHETDMVEFQIARNRADQRLKCEPVGIECSLGAWANSIGAIAGLHFGSYPVPTSVGDFDLLPETSDCRGIGYRTPRERIAVPHPAEIVPIAQAAHTTPFWAPHHSAWFGWAGSQPATIVRRAKAATESVLGTIRGGTLVLHRKLTPFGAMRHAVPCGAAAFIIPGAAA